MVSALSQPQYAALTGRRIKTPLRDIIHAQMPSHREAGRLAYITSIDERSLAETARANAAREETERNRLDIMQKQEQMAAGTDAVSLAAGTYYVGKKLGWWGAKQAAETLPIAATSGAAAGAAAGAASAGTLQAIPIGTSGAQAVGTLPVAGGTGGAVAAGESASLASTAGSVAAPAAVAGFVGGKIGEKVFSGEPRLGAAGGGVAAGIAAGFAAGGPIGAVVGGLIGGVTGYVSRKCIIVSTCCGEDTFETRVSREYRDRFLLPQTICGYYKVALKIVPMLEKYRVMRFVIKRLLVDRLVDFGACALGYKRSRKYATSRPMTAFFLGLCWGAGEDKEVSK